MASESKVGQLGFDLHVSPGQVLVTFIHCGTRTSFLVSSEQAAVMADDLCTAAEKSIEMLEQAELQ